MGMTLAALSMGELKFSVVTNFTAAEPNQFICVWCDH